MESGSRLPQSKAASPQAFDAAGVPGMRKLASALTHSELVRSAVQGSRAAPLAALSYNARASPVRTESGTKVPQARAALPRFVLRGGTSRDRGSDQSGQNPGRFTFHVSRFTFHVSRFTFHVARLPIASPQSEVGRRTFPIFESPSACYSKKGTPGAAYLRMPSSLISTPIPGFSESGMNPSTTIGPSNETISLYMGSSWK